MTEILNFITKSYQSEMFLPLCIITPLLSIFSFLFWSLPWTYIAYKDPESIRKYKVQKKKIDVSKWFWPSMKKIIINSAIMLASVILIWPLLNLSNIHSGEWEAWYIIAAQLIFFIFLDDFLYYWTHRAMHHGWLYKNVHSVHHKVVTPCSIAGNYFHWIEFNVTTALVLVGPIIVGCHIYTLWIYVIIRQLEAADGHCGYDIPYNPTHLIPLYHGPSYHDFHHKKFFGNYAAFLSYLDQFFGGYSKGYPEYHEETTGKRGLKSLKKK